MIKRFNEQVVLVTGGTSGLGATACELFVKEGAKVLITDIESREVAKVLGPNVAYRDCDVSDASSCLAAVESCVSRFGRIDVLFHNAARLSPIATVPDLRVDTFQQLINTNLCGAFYLANAVIPHMRNQGRGVIINTSSISGFGADYGMAAYNAAKAGLIGLTKGIAIDHARDGIRAVTICPGYMNTRMTEGVRASGDELLADLFESIPMGRAAELYEVAQAVLFLASAEASYITGHPFIVDGGWIARNASPRWLKYLK